MVAGLAYTLITKPAELEDLTRHLSGEELIAVDTESNSLFAYQERVCLVQFSTINHDFLVDPLALPGLEPLATIFANDKIEKIFHAAEYDLVCLKRDFGFCFNNIFDTMVVSRILGKKSVGLGSLLQAEFGVEVNKRYQRANWGERPLPDHLLDYARMDTHYLIPLRNRLLAALVERRLDRLAQEDFKRLEQVEGNTNSSGKDHGGVWHVRGANDLSPQQMAILQELCRYRDRVAREIDRPLFKVIQDRTLVEIAESEPENLKELGKIFGMSERQVRRHGNQLLQAVRRGQQADPIFPSRSPRPSDAYLRRLEQLRNWRKETAAKLHVPSDVVLPKDIMEALALKNPQSKNALNSVMVSVPYRLEKFGDQILITLPASSKSRGAKETKSHPHN